MMRLRLALAVALLGVMLSGCSTFSSKGGSDYAPDSDEVPEDVLETPDAVPTDEPPSKYGNPKSYTVFGKTYTVMRSAKGFKQRGYASWYAKKFHGRNTANGEVYDIFGMTAAHKNLPLPSFVRVTNLDNGKTVVVRVNDRGPFHSDRIIDLSYTAAAKLGIIGHGTARVEIAAITSDDDAAPAPAATPNAELRPVAQRGFLQVGAYSSRINARALRDELAAHDIDRVEIREVTSGSSPLYRVLVGPFDSAEDAQSTRDQLLLRSLKALWVGE